MVRAAEKARLVEQEMRSIFLETAILLTQAGEFADRVVVRIEFEDRLRGGAKPSCAGKDSFQLAIETGLRRVRLRSGLTQSELAGRAGTSRQTLNVLESGRGQPATPLRRIVRACNLHRNAMAATPACELWLMDGRAKPGQPEVIRRGALFATATLSLGLESIARGDVGKARDALRTIAVSPCCAKTVVRQGSFLGRGLPPASDR